jgi:type VI protein secretion system component Hcp
MQTKKIRDILPPGREKAQEPERETSQDVLVGRSVKRGKKRTLSLLFLIILIAGIGGVLSLQFFFAKAQVIFHPYTREVIVQAHITARADIQESDTEKSIPALVIEEEKSLTRLFPATGTLTEQGRARGTVRVFNGFSTFPQKLVAQTRFLSEDGKLFRSPGAVTVPAGRMEGGTIVAGFLDIEVVAAESGEEYNIGPSNFSLPGLFGNPAYTTITGKSGEPMTGGSKTEVSVVTEFDLNAARDALVAELQQKVRESLGGKVSEDMVLLSDAVDLQVAQAFSPIKAGASLDNFNFSVRVQGTAVIFPRTDVENAARALAAELAEAGEKIAEQSVSIEYENVEMNMNTQSLSFDMKASLPLYKEIDPMEFKGRLAGLSKDEAALALSQDPGLQKAEILLFPFWLEYLPQDPNKMEISIVVD